MSSLIRSIPDGNQCKIVLPPSLENFFQEAGYCESTYYEGRKNSRLRIRCKATLVIEASPPSIERPEQTAIVFVKDISKRGIAILCHQQLWPEEKLLICFQQRQVRASAVRCRRLDECCWECGAEITEFKNLEDDV
jgi:hypothetical protein